MPFTKRTMLPACLLVLGAGLLMPQTASAAMVGFTMRITPYRGGGTNAGNVGFPYVDLTNDAASADILDYQLTIGDSANYFWDVALVNASSQISSANATNVTPGTTLDNMGGPVIHFTFGSGIFAPGVTFSHRNDIDRTSEVGQSEVYTVNQPDFTTVLFDANGSDTSDNAVVTVKFSDGQTVSAHVPEFAATVDNYYTFSVSQVPEPATLSVLALGAAGLVLRRRRR